MHPEGNGYPNGAVSYAVPEGGEGDAGAFKGGSPGGGALPANGRTEALINRGGQATAGRGVGGCSRTGG